MLLSHLKSESSTAVDQSRENQAEENYITYSLKTTLVFEKQQGALESCCVFYQGYSREQSSWSTLKSC